MDNNAHFNVKQNIISNHGVRKCWIYWTLRLLTLWNYMELLGTRTLRELSDLLWTVQILGW